MAPSQTSRGIPIPQMSLSCRAKNKQSDSDAGSQSKHPYLRFSSRQTRVIVTTRNQAASAFVVFEGRKSPQKGFSPEVPNSPSLAGNF